MVYIFSSTLQVYINLYTSISHIQVFCFVSMCGLFVLAGWMVWQVLDEDVSWVCYHLVLRVVITTVVWENFGVKKIADAQWCLKIKLSKYFLQWIIIATKANIEVANATRDKSKKCLPSILPSATIDCDGWVLASLSKPPCYNVNAGAPEASSKWCGVIKVIAQIVLWQQLFAYFWIRTVVSSDHP